MPHGPEGITAYGVGGRPQSKPPAAPTWLKLEEKVGHTGMGSCRVGTSGWNYAHWRECFYPKGLPGSKWFGHYATVFDTVEVNNTFYHLPEVATFKHWRQQAPDDFIYAVKASRYITHMKRLIEPREALRLFLQRARRLGRHLGPVLYQLPPSFRPNLERLRAFCRMLPKALTHVIEFRHKEWLAEATFDLLAEYQVCLCLHDIIPNHPRRVTGKAAYVRFHGVGSKYGGSYGEDQLAEWAKWMRVTAEGGVPVYAYFNNDGNAYAVYNAQTLRRLLQAG